MRPAGDEKIASQVWSRYGSYWKNGSHGRFLFGLQIVTCQVFRDQLSLTKKAPTVLGLMFILFTCERLDNKMATVLDLYGFVGTLDI